MTRKTSLSRQSSLSNPTHTILTQLSRQSSLTVRTGSSTWSTSFLTEKCKKKYLQKVHEVRNPSLEENSEFAAP
jgi:hypothetical protein